MEGEVLALVIGGIFVLLLLIILGGVRTIINRLNDAEQSLDISWLPDPVEDAIRYAANYVEQLDKEGAFDSFYSKADEKLDAAIEEAVRRLEEWSADLGVNIDIPETVLNDLIQRYVWENPDLFPSRGSSKPVPEVDETADNTDGMTE